MNAQLINRQLQYAAFIIACNLFIISSSVAQHAGTASSENSSWSVSWKKPKAFIENKGQFSVNQYEKVSKSEILYAVDEGQTMIYFSKKGLTYLFRKGEKEEKKVIIETDRVELEWENANAHVQIIAEEKTTGYHSYTFFENGTEKNINYIKGFKKITYKNLYPNIDVEYVFHIEGGIKYSLILHPGADISNLKMKYSDTKKVSLNEKGEIHIATNFGDIIDHSPYTFYADNKQSAISSKFIRTDKSISFQLDNYDHSKTVIIDPWIQTPTLANSNGVWECEKDGAGNVYIIGGDMPMVLEKYTSTGAWVWSYSTPWDTANYWLGTLATDLAGNSYVTAGSLAKIQKVDANAGMTWSNTGGSLDEYWNIAFNCDQTKLIIGGTRLNGFPAPTGDGMIFDINTGNGNINNFKKIGTSRTYTITLPPPFPPTTITDIEEARSITSSRNAKYYFLTLDTIGAIDQNLSACPDAKTLFGINHTYSFGYKCENYRPNNGNSGIMAIRANGRFVYTQNGTTLHKRSLATGAILLSAAIPGGINTSNYGLNQPGNSGIDIDSCGNVYVGSGNAVLEYDSNLNVLNSVSTSFSVFDVAVSYGGNIIVCGATGNSSDTSRTGYVQAINMSACNPMTLFCCDATVCPAGPYCTTDAPVTLTAVTAGGIWSGTGITNASTGTFDPSVADTGTFTIIYTLGCGSDSITITVTCCGAEINPAGPFCIADAPVTLTPAASGGTWSGTGITNASTGTFDPSVAGAGTHTIVYTISGCGSDSVTITVSTCAVLIVCIETNGDLTVSNGTVPYTWQEQSTTQDCSTCSGFPWPPCSFPPGCVVDVTSWSSFGTTPTVTPPGTFPIRVFDNTGDTLVINSLSGLPNCTACSVSSGTSFTNTSCGNNNGTATVTVSGGTSPFTYNWSNAQTTSVATGLASGSYSVTVTDGGGCTVTGNVTVGSSSSPAVNTSSTAATCGSSNGTTTATASGGAGSYTYNWSNSQTTSTATGLAANSYNITVTDGGGCTVAGNITVGSSSGPTVTTTSTQANCGNSNGSATATASGGTLPYTYTWSNSQTNSVATGLSVGSYSVTVTDVNTCTALSGVSVSSSGGPSTAMTSGNVTCYNGSNGLATLTASGGSPPYTYVWSNGSTTSNIQLLIPDTYTVTVTDAGGCSALDSAIITQPSAITISFNVNNATCGLSDGTAAATVAGGSSPYTYVWSNSATTSLISTLASGTYLITVTDASACTKKDSAMIFSVGGASISLNTITPVTCYGSSDGAIAINTNGGTIPYTYSWSNGATTEDISGIAAGDFYLTLTDNSNCSSFDTFTVSEPAGITISVFKQDANCGGSDGSAWIDAGGGTPGYLYSWGGGQTTDSISGIVAGNYFVTVSDLNGCTESDTVTVNEAGAPVLSIDSIKNVSCNGGSDGTAAVTATNGVPPYTYLWSNGNSTSNIQLLTSNTYTVTVTDNNGCKSIQNATLTQPTVLSSAITSTNESCTAKGTATDSASGGTPLYTFAWSNGAAASITGNLSAGKYYVTVTDLNGCSAQDSTLIIKVGSVTATITGDDEICKGNTLILTGGGGGTYLWSTGETTSLVSVTPVSTTIYNLRVSQGSCSDTAYFKVVVDFTVVINAGKDTSIFIDETATLTGMVYGGTSPFTFIWKPDNPPTQSITVTPPTTTQYVLSVVDAKGCSASDSVVVTVLPCDAEVFVPNAFAPGCNCKDNKLKVFSDCIETMQFFIYDRWGEKVYESSDPKKGWDGMYLGKPMNAAAYVYYLKYTTINAPDEVKVMEGNVNLVR